MFKITIYFRFENLFVCFYFGRKRIISCGDVVTTNFLLKSQIHEQISALQQLWILRLHFLRDQVSLKLTIQNKLLDFYHLLKFLYLEVLA